VYLFVKKTTNRLVVIARPSDEPVSTKELNESSALALRFQGYSYLNILYEALRLIGLVDQAVSGTGSDADVNSAVDLM
jgi:hypothetical protein